MGRKKIVAKTKTSEMNYGEPREIKTLKPRVRGMKDKWIWVIRKN